MKTLFASFVSACFLGALFLGTPAAAVAADGAEESAMPHKVALIDMATVFEQYKKFEELRKELRGEMEQGEAKLQELGKQLIELQKELTSGTLKEGSPEQIEKEKEFTKMQAEAEATKRDLQREFARKEAKIYQTVYNDATAAVSKAATKFQYTLVLRYSREQPNINDPQALMQFISRQIVYHRDEDDITDMVVKYLNDKYEKTGRGDTGVKAVSGEANSADEAQGARRSAANPRPRAGNQ